MKSPPDGYTIMLTSVDHAVIPQMLPTPYDPIKDFAPVGTVSFTQLLLVVHPSVPANTLQEFIALAKSKPGQLNYASSGSGGVPHLTSEMFSTLAGIRMQHIPYKGGGPAMVDLVGGQVQADVCHSDQRHSLCQGGQAEGACHHRRKPARSSAPGADVHRSRCARPGREDVVCHLCSGRNTQAHRRSPVERNRQDPRHARRQGKAACAGHGSPTFPRPTNLP